MDDTAWGPRRGGDSVATPSSVLGERGQYTDTDWCSQRGGDSRANTVQCPGRRVTAQPTLTGVAGEEGQHGSTARGPREEGTVQMTSLPREEVTARPTLPSILGEEGTAVCLTLPCYPREEGTAWSIPTSVPREQGTGQPRLPGIPSEERTVWTTMTGQSRGDSTVNTTQCPITGGDCE